MVYLRELGGIELRGQLFQQGADRRFAEMAGSNAANDSVMAAVTIPDRSDRVQAMRARAC